MQQSISNHNRKNALNDVHHYVQHLDSNERSAAQFQARLKNSELQNTYDRAQKIGSFVPWIVGCIVAVAGLMIGSHLGGIRALPAIIYFSVISGLLVTSSLLYCIHSYLNKIIHKVHDTYIPVSDALWSVETIDDQTLQKAFPALEVKTRMQTIFELLKTVAQDLNENVELDPIFKLTAHSSEYALYDAAERTEILRDLDVYISKISGTSDMATNINTPQFQKAVM